MALISVKNRAEFDLLKRLLLSYQHEIVRQTQHAASHGDSHYIHPDAGPLAGILTELRDTEIALSE